MPRTKNAPLQRNRGRLRIIGGQWKRHTLYFKGGADLRPTPDAIREKLFNWLAPVIEGACCLDLFCGSGALGFEAASRGAAQVVLVDNNRQCYEEINKNRVRLGAQQIRVFCEDALEWLGSNNQTFDIVFLDPPYNSDLAPAVLPTGARYDGVCRDRAPPETDLSRTLGRTAQWSCRSSQLSPISDHV